jgi:hypothetical protein
METNSKLRFSLSDVFLRVLQRIEIWNHAVSWRGFYVTSPEFMGLAVSHGTEEGKDRKIGGIEREKKRIASKLWPSFL